MPLLKPLPPETAIRTRLFYYIGGGLVLVWLMANAVSLTLALRELNESADSQMSELARALPYIESDELVRLPGVEESLGDEGEGFAEDKHNGIAIWNEKGELLLADQKGGQIPYSEINGFTDTAPVWDDDSFRVVYYHNPDNGLTAAVSQRWHERLEMLWHIVWVQLAASLLVLPVLALLLHIAVKRSIRPLNLLADDLAARRADNLAPVSRAVPRETQPVIDALNRLFERVQTASEREKRFTADAAHELRSPLAALKVQTEVLEMSEADEQPYHLHQIRESISRAEHLVNQLLTLARLDPGQGLKQREPVNWDTLSSQVLQQCNLAAREKRIRLKRELAANPLPLTGDATLLQLMLRNLIDNAVRYSPEHSEVRLILSDGLIEVRDHGAGIAPEHLARIKERFYRPAGQNAQGSGLGLSIVEQIAALHGLSVTLENRPEGGLSVQIRKT